VDRIPLWPLARKVEGPTRLPLAIWIVLPLLALLVIGVVLLLVNRPAAVLWAYPTLDTPLGPLIAVDGMAFTATRDGTVYALNVADGQPLWRSPLHASTITSPAVFYGMVFIASTTGEVAALQLTTGEAVWRASAGSPVTGITVAQSLLIAATDHGRLLALDPLTGQTLWETRFPQGLGQPLVAPPHLLVGDAAGRLHCLTLAQGQLIWSVSLVGAVQTGAAVTNQSVAVATSASRAYLLDRSQGKVLWTRRLPAPPVSAPFTVGDWVIFPAGSSLLAYDLATGARRWRQRLGGLITCPPLPSGGYLLVGNSRGRVYQVSTTDGRKSRLALRAASPVAALGEDDDRLLVGDWRGLLLCVLRPRQ